MPLKTYLDLERAKVASRLLEYSDLNITEIAETLDFPDVFSFSRFFRRVVGMSPRPFRQSARARHREPAETPHARELPAEYVADGSETGAQQPESDYAR
jgi:AraC-like DNA-binding protein